MGMTTPKTATVRFSPRRKCSLPAEERDGTRERERGRVRLDSRAREDTSEKKCVRNKVIKQGRQEGGEPVEEEGDKTER